MKRVPLVGWAAVALRVAPLVGCSSPEPAPESSTGEVGQRVLDRAGFGKP